MPYRNVSAILGLFLLLALSMSPAYAASSSRIRTTSRKIVTFRHDVARSTAESIIDQAGDAAIVRTVSDQTRAVEITAEELENLSERGEVVRIEDDIEVQALARVVPQTLPWNVQRIGAPSAWHWSKGSGVKVAIVDTGLDLDHPDLAGSIVQSANFVRSARSADDDSGHGSHVGGIVAAADNSVGYVGVAPHAQLMAVKVLDRRGVGYLSDIIAGIDWAVANGAKVINMSLGTGTDIQALHDAVIRARNAGVVVTAAAGNSGGAVMYPAAYSEVIAVGMTDVENMLNRKSARGQALDIVAPGESIESTYEKGKYRKMTGTSMASPHVAGVAALLIANPRTCDRNNDNRCDVGEVEQRLYQTATDFGGAGRDDLFGYGLVSASRALTP